MKHDPKCECKPPHYECQCAQRAYLATATHTERLEFEAAKPGWRSNREANGWPSGL